MQSILTLLRRRTGLIFSAARWPSIERTLQRARAHTAASGWSAYQALLESDGDALADLVAELTVGESYFFRDDEQFALLAQRILPSLAERRLDGPITIWSAGCASGEEAYSLAMVCDEMGLLSRVRVAGADLSSRRIDAARTGRFGRWALRGVSDARIDRYFIRRGAAFEVVPHIREAVTFGNLNFADDEGWARAVAPGAMDLILCRNVLIYLDEPTIARTAAHLLDALSDDGWLLLGASDPVLSNHVECHVEVTDAGLAYRRARRSDEPRAVAGARRPAVLRVERDAGPQPVGSPQPLAASSAPGTGAAWTLTELLTEIRAVADRGANEAALRLCAVGVAAYPGSAELAALESVVLGAEGRAAAAVAAARRAIYLDRGFVMAHIALADAVLRLGNRAQATRSLRAALRLLDDSSPAVIVPGSGGLTASHLTALLIARLSSAEESA